MSITRQKISLLVCTGIAVFMCVMPLIAFGAEPSFVALEPIPGISGANAGSDIGAFVSNVFRALISLGALLAVFMLTLGAVQYMTSETLGLKEAGKERMQSAIWGLLLLISSVLILYVINPELLNFNLIVNSTKPLNIGTAADQFAASFPPGNAAPSGPGAQPGAPGNGAAATTKAAAEALIGNSDLSFWGTWNSFLFPAGTSSNPGAGSPQTRTLVNTDEAAAAEVVRFLKAAERGPCFVWQGASCSAAPGIPPAAPSTLVTSCGQQGVGVRFNAATNAWVCSTVK